MRFIFKLVFFFYFWYIKNRTFYEASFPEKRSPFFLLLPFSKRCVKGRKCVFIKWYASLHFLTLQWPSYVPHILWTQFFETALLKPIMGAALFNPPVNFSLQGSFFREAASQQLPPTPHQSMWGRKVFYLRNVLGRGKIRCRVTMRGVWGESMSFGESSDPGLPWCLALLQYEGGKDLGDINPGLLLWGQLDIDFVTTRHRLSVWET